MEPSSLTDPIGRRGAPAPSEAKVVRLPFPETDAQLVSAVIAGRADAARAFFDRFSDDVERLLYRILGPDPEIADLLQEVFLIGLTELRELRKPEAARSWLGGIAVRRAKKLIRRRRRGRFMLSTPPGDLPEREAVSVPVEVSDALVATYRTLRKLPDDERVAFALRHIDGMELTELAAVTGVSLATVKRQLMRAHAHFLAYAREEVALAAWVHERSFQR